MQLAWCLVHTAYFSWLTSSLVLLICHQCKAGKFWNLILVRYEWIYICEFFMNVCYFVYKEGCKILCEFIPIFSSGIGFCFLLVILLSMLNIFLCLCYTPLSSWLVIIFCDKSAVCYRCFFQSYMPSIDVQTCSASRFFHVSHHFSLVSYVLIKPQFSRVIFYFDGFRWYYPVQDFLQFFLIVCLTEQYNFFK